MKRLRVKAEPSSSSHVYVEEPYTTDFSDFSLVQHKSPPVDRWLEAQILPGDTLQAIALRFNCSIPQLKKLNKIDKDNEIYARNVIRVPVTPHSILLETLPRVHTSGNSSPKNITNTPPNVDHVPVVASKVTLDEKLILAAVSNASIQPSSSAATQFPKKSSGKQHRDLSARSNEIELEDLHDETDELVSQPLLLSGEYDDSIPQPRSLRLPANDFSCNGSDCDISWICLLVFILALCFAIPLIYVVYVAEHIDKYHHDSFNNINNHSTKL